MYRLLMNFWEPSTSRREAIQLNQAIQRLMPQKYKMDWSCWKSNKYHSLWAIYTTRWRIWSITIPRTGDLSRWTASIRHLSCKTNWSKKSSNSLDPFTIPIRIQINQTIKRSKVILLRTCLEIKSITLHLWSKRSMTVLNKVISKNTVNLRVMT